MDRTFGPEGCGRLSAAGCVEGGREKGSEGSKGSARLRQAGSEGGGIAASRR